MTPVSETSNLPQLALIEFLITLSNFLCFTQSMWNVWKKPPLNHAKDYQEASELMDEALKFYSESLRVSGE